LHPYKSDTSKQDALNPLQGSHKHYKEIWYMNSKKRNRCTKNKAEMIELTHVPSLK
jgi:hypothetical protein